MTLNQLNYYVEIVRQGSFTKAAEKLFVSQSTLSKAIRALEEEFQMELINRGAKEFQLTPQGNVCCKDTRFLPYPDTGIVPAAAQRGRNLEAGNPAYGRGDIFLLNPVSIPQ